MRGSGGRLKTEGAADNKPRGSFYLQLSTYIPINNLTVGPEYLLCHFAALLLCLFFYSFTLHSSTCKPLPAVKISRHSVHPGRSTATGKALQQSSHAGESLASALAMTTNQPGIGYENPHLSHTPTCAAEHCECRPLKAGISRFPSIDRLGRNSRQTVVCWPPVGQWLYRDKDSAPKQSICVGATMPGHYLVKGSGPDLCSCILTPVSETAGAVHRCKPRAIDHSGNASALETCRHSPSRPFQ